MASYGPNHTICTCNPLGCSLRQFEKNGEILTGRLFHKTNYPRHLQASIAQATVNVPEDTLSTTAPTTTAQSSNNISTNIHSVAPVGSLKRPRSPEPPSTSSSFHTESQPRLCQNARLTDSTSNQETITARVLHKRPRSPDTGPTASTSRLPTDPPLPKNSRLTNAASYQLRLSTEEFYTPRVLLQHPSCVQSMISVLNDHLLRNASVKACHTSLQLEQLKVKSSFLSQDSSSKPIWDKIPNSLPKLIKCFHLEARILRTLSCPVCFALHGPPVGTPTGKGLKKQQDASVTNGRYRVVESNLALGNLGDIDLGVSSASGSLLDSSINFSHSSTQTQYDRAAKLKTDTETTQEPSDNHSDKTVDSNGTIQVPKGPSLTITELEQTMMKKYQQRASFQQFLRNVPPDYAEQIGADIILQNSSPKKKNSSPSSDVCESIKPILEKIGLTTCVNFEKTTSWRHSGKVFSTYSKHPGNSYVEFHHHGKKGVGVIHHIIYPESHSTPIFVLHVFPPLDPIDENRNPYRLVPHLHATVMYNEDLSLQSILPEHLFGHCAALHNQPGTFSISKATLSLNCLFVLKQIDSNTLNIFYDFRVDPTFNTQSLMYDKLTQYANER
ncbi:uncharacterized protein MELLADRAFT_101675 [Melampsora larici-populina 98AG31]|uniref:Uncharacterized protein n=1 Tax=Melampsora larici-populina (strain 98AG31 / pathotype 3-4-7) TaxID=747676 RepID=F4R6L8_MELLP|nr:uncharacterized protein MELLADRAFT_101675 [Melampsora larici-populina 98AG31]EGG12440.1 hypothetical protein MELLADRAFT_101675 [Melampsora larici-populina 98AG31]